ncbi:MAG: hypothetical protein L0Y36_03920 [Planctomycetales bacterium]|nr:hypothetical protein [Planctomycetales bacterium]
MVFFQGFGILSKRQGIPKKLLYCRAVEGIIAHVGTKKEAEALIATGIPLIAQCVQQRITACPSMVTEDAMIGKMAAEHLQERGLKHVAFCGFEESS